MDEGNNRQKGAAVVSRKIVLLWGAATLIALTCFALPSRADHPGKGAVFVGCYDFNEGGATLKGPEPKQCVFHKATLLTRMYPSNAIRFPPPFLASAGEAGLKEPTREL